MADLKREYTDIKNVKHNVEHIVLSNDKNSKEQMIEEIFYEYKEEPDKIVKEMDKWSLIH